MAASKILAKILAATTVASLTLPIAPAVSAETTIFLNGFLNPPLADASSALQGRYSSGNLVNLRYPKFSPFVGAAINTGTNNLDATVQTTTSGPITVVGYSLGAAVIDSYLRRLATDTDAPGPDEIQFVMVENPLRPGGFVHSFLPTGTVIPIVDLRVQAPPDPIYNTTIVIQEYDGIADWPDDMLNLLAVANAAIGSGVFTPFLPSPHGAGVTADLDAVPEENITVEQNSNGTTTTTYLVPTTKLPLTYIFRLALPDAWVDVLDSILRPIIDAGYSRNVNNAAASIGPAETPGAAASAEPAEVAGAEPAEAAVAEPAEAAVAEPAEAAMAEPDEAAGDLSDDAPALSVTEDIVD
ncbi:MAG: PE-PPE domain-containing protein, partial [Actinomycetia bacterium]|nr:PE-PPE domain-containing protein [Actinomycetes bacterium]